MPAPEDDRFLSPQEIKSAAAHGHLPLLAERLARERSWLALASVFEQVVALPISAQSLTEAVRRCMAALREGTERRRDRERLAANDDLRTVRLLAGEALIARVPVPPLTDPDRRALAVGASALAEGGDLQRAATTFEQAEDWAAAAEVWGRLGELEQMEACLGRDEDRTRSRRAALGAARDIEALSAAGERVAALRLAEGMREGVAESAAARQIALALGARLVRGRSVTFRVLEDGVTRDEGTGRGFCYAGTPAVLGRDPGAEISLRDPGTSRRHALLAPAGDEWTLTDAGSRAGTFVAGARLSAPLVLRGTTEVELGRSCRLELQLPGPGRVTLRGLSGLDRGMLAVVGRGPLPLSDLLPHLSPSLGGAWLEFDFSGVHFCHAPELRVRIGGQLVSARVDLLHGDTLELGDGGVRLEVA